MKELLKELITEFQEEPIPKPVQRQITVTNYPSLRKAHVFMGMRRSGKTWLMYQDMQERLLANQPKEKLLYLNFEDDRLISFKAEHFQGILSAYTDLYPQFVNDPEVAFYFDEIHLIENWEKFIRRLLDKEKMAVYVTGSSAKMLSKEISTSLRGRAISTEVFPFSFSEYLHFNGVNTTRALSSKTKSLIRHHSQTYFTVGGFPETLFTPPEHHRALLQDYVNTVVFRDVVERYEISNIAGVKHYLLHCLQNLSSPLSITKIFHSLKSAGSTVSRNSLYDYLDYFEEAYLLFSVSLYDLSLRKRQINPKKIYSIDPGIISAYAVNPDFSHGPTFENAVFLQLRRNFEDIYYYKTKTNKEIDFVVMTATGTLTLYQCCISMKNEKTAHREILALLEAAEELKISTLFIITFDQEEIITQNGLNIHVIPFWKWALS